MTSSGEVHHRLLIRHIQKVPMSDLARESLETMSWESICKSPNTAFGASKLDQVAASLVRPMVGWLRTFYGQLVEEFGGDERVCGPVVSAILESYRVQKSLTRTDTGSAYNAVRLVDNTSVVLKIIRDRESAEAERQVLCTARGKVPGMITLVEDLPCARQHNLTILATSAVQHCHPSPDELPVLATQLFTFLHHFHAAKFRHGDLKPEHLLWDGEQLRVIDYGSAFVGSRRSVDVRTTASFRAPEQTYDAASDMWSAGLSLLHLALPATDTQPSLGPHLRGLAQKQLDAEVLRLRERAVTQHPGFWTALVACLKIEASERPSATAALRLLERSGAQTGSIATPTASSSSSAASHRVMSALLSSPSSTATAATSTDARPAIAKEAKCLPLSIVAVLFIVICVLSLCFRALATLLPQSLVNAITIAVGRQEDQRQLAGNVEAIARPGPGLA